MEKERHERYACISGRAKTGPAKYGGKDREIDVK